MGNLSFLGVEIYVISWNVWIVAAYSSSHGNRDTDTLQFISGHTSSTIPLLSTMFYAYCFQTFQMGFFFLALLGLCAALICPDGGMCEDDDTCFKNTQGGYGCCPLPHVSYTLVSYLQVTTNCIFCTYQNNLFPFLPKLHLHMVFCCFTSVWA